MRHSTNFLEWLGDLGGFQAAIAMAIAFLSNFFSSRFFEASIAENFYIRSLSSEERKGKKSYESITNP
jgi:hypothetical protein